ncbi:methyltransferase domain-containing protein [Rhodopseudomonas palustris]
MNVWYNETGRPLSSTSWLNAHHRAKLKERTAFARSLLDMRPRRIVDLGCGPGLWLETLNGIVPPDCEFVGIDSDSAALDEAKSRAKEWERSVQFLNVDIEKSSQNLPEADMFLAFNLFPYFTHPEKVLTAVKSRIAGSGRLVIRQYDGALLRFGPLDQGRRGRIEMSLHTSVMGSSEFQHYDLDRLFQLLASSSFENKHLEFELFQRASPYPEDFLQYVNNTIDWMARYAAEDASAELKRWQSEFLCRGSPPSYFVEVDLVGWLS